MAKSLEITLSLEQRHELEYARDHHKRPYIRERAAAILKIAEGMSGLQVAIKGLFKRRKSDTIYKWVHRYLSRGIEGLRIDPGRGRKPAYFSRHPEEEGARMAILHVVRRDPRLFGHRESRWSLVRIAQSCDWLRITTPSGLSQLLDRLGISYKRGRSYIHSPDIYYNDKLSLIELCLLKAYYDPIRNVFLYQDEVTYYRQPTLAYGYEAKGHHQPLAYWSHRSNNQFRITATLNAISGKVSYRQHNVIGLRQLSDFYADVRNDYPHAQQIFIAQDNWPVHFHPDVLARLQPQNFTWQPKLPKNWPSEPTPKAIHDDLPIKLLLLPTYASWLNPIEKLWRWLRQDVLHLHRLGDDWVALKQLVADFLDQFIFGSNDLLTYVGLLPV